MVPADFYFCDNWIQPVISQGHIIFVFIDQQGNFSASTFYICHQDWVISQTEADKIYSALEPIYQHDYSQDNPGLFAYILKSRFEQESCLYGNLVSILLEALKAHPYNSRFIYDDSELPEIANMKYPGEPWSVDSCYGPKTKRNDIF